MTAQSKIQNPKSEIVDRCAYCADPPILWSGLVVNPPMCPAHYDLSVLVEFMTARGLPITVESVQAQLTRARNNSDQWVLTADQVPALLPDLVPVELAAIPETKGG